MPVFTTETARQAAANSAIVRQSRRNAEEAKVAQAEKIIAAAAQSPALAEALGVRNDEFITRRILRVREQIERLSALLDEEEDPQALDRIASAISRLSTLEREYAMRPAPGTLKPTQPKTPKHTQLPPAPDTQ